ncbi:hypothetical protein FB451DRAFT_1537031 [Mycena latifolia]|nr:hypothetical protein FB451DRAFT_1537031 [Mycena latifolia]
MHTTLPWPVSPEFEDALALATQRHLAQPATAPSTPPQLPLPAQHTLAVLPSASDPRPLSPSSVPRSASLMMKTRVAVRDKTPHRFQVVPLRDAAQNNREKPPAKQPSAPWTRQFALLRPSGVGLGLVPIQQRAATETPERGRERERTRCDVFGGEARAVAARRGVLRGLQGLSPQRPRGSPDRKENRTPRSPTKRALRRHREYTFDAAAGLESSIVAAGDTTIRAPVASDEIHATLAADAASQTTQETAAAMAPQSTQVQEMPTVPVPAGEDITMTIDLQPASPTKAKLEPEPLKRRPASRHFKSPSLGAIHHLLSTPTSVSVPALPALTPATAPTPAVTDNDDTPRVRCRKRTNTLSAAGTKRYGVYRDTLDFGLGPGSGPTQARADESMAHTRSHADETHSAATDKRRVASTYSLGALLSAYAYSHDSLPSLYSQESFVECSLGLPLPLAVGAGALRVECAGTRPLRVHPHARGNKEAQGKGEAQGPHAIVMQLLREVDVAIGEWL